MLDNARRHPKATVAMAGLLVAVLVATLLATRSRSAPSLPRVSARALVASAIRAVAANRPVSGTGLVHVDLGLPSLPSSDAAPGTGPLGALSELSGDHTLRVWRSRSGVRIAELLPAAERAVFATRHALWLWDSSNMTASRLVTSHASGAQAPGTEASGPLDPEALAAKALRAITPTTAVTVGPPATVAGRPVYPLVLRPRTSRTLVGAVEVDVDGATRIPLRVAVTARGASRPAVSFVYRSVRLGPIDASVFSFTPPPGSTVRTIRAPSPPQRHPVTAAPRRASDRVRTFGRGWTSIVAVRIPSLSAIAAKRPQAGGLVRLLPYTGPLLSIRLADRADHAWVVAGLVPQSALATVDSRLP